MLAAIKETLRSQRLKAATFALSGKVIVIVKRLTVKLPPLFTQKKVSLLSGSSLSNFSFKPAVKFKAALGFTKVCACVAKTSKRPDWMESELLLTLAFSTAEAG